MKKWVKYTPHFGSVKQRPVLSLSVSLERRRTQMSNEHCKKLKTTTNSSSNNKHTHTHTHTHTQTHKRIYAKLGRVKSMGTMHVYGVSSKSQETTTMCDSKTFVIFQSKKTHKKIRPQKLINSCSYSYSNILIYSLIFCIALFLFIGVLYLSVYCFFSRSQNLFLSSFLSVISVVSVISPLQQYKNQHVRTSRLRCSSYHSCASTITNSY
jgi:hypothetical protein